MNIECVKPCEMPINSRTQSNTNICHCTRFARLDGLRRLGLVERRLPSRAAGRTAPNLREHPRRSSLFRCVLAQVCLGLSVNWNWEAEPQAGKRADESVADLYYRFYVNRCLLNTLQNIEFIQPVRDCQNRIGGDQEMATVLHCHVCREIETEWGSLFGHIPLPICTCTLTH